MFIIQDLSRNPPINQAVNDTKDAADVILGITGNENLAKKAKKWMADAHFGDSVEMRPVKIQCVNPDVSTNPRIGPYLLIEVIEQDISEPAFFETRAAAQEEMMRRLKTVMGLTDKDLASAESVPGGDGLKTIDYDTFFSESRARCEMDGQNYDWQIFDIRNLTNI